MSKKRWRIVGVAMVVIAAVAVLDPFPGNRVYSNVYGDAGPVEVEALERGDYLAISRSTAKKAEIIGQVVVKYVEGRLMTAGSKQRRRKRWSVLKQDALPRELIGSDEASRLLAEAKIPQPHKIGRRTL